MKHDTLLKTAYYSLPRGCFAFIHNQYIFPYHKEKSDEHYTKYFGKVPKDIFCVDKNIEYGDKLLVRGQKIVLHEKRKRTYHDQLSRRYHIGSKTLQNTPRI